MEKSALINSDLNYDWNFLNYPIHTVSANPEQTLKELQILFGHVQAQMKRYVLGNLKNSSHN